MICALHTQQTVKTQRHGADIASWALISLQNGQQGQALAWSAPPWSNAGLYSTHCSKALLFLCEHKENYPSRNRRRRNFLTFSDKRYQNKNSALQKKAVWWECALSPLRSVSDQSCVRGLVSGYWSKWGCRPLWPLDTYIGLISVRKKHTLCFYETWVTNTFSRDQTGDGNGQSGPGRGVVGTAAHWRAGLSGCICWGCYNKSILGWVARTTEIHFLVILEATSPRPGSWYFWFLLTHIALRCR